MNYKRTVAPTADPITLDEAKAQCSLAGIDDHDDYIAGLIGRATETIEKILGRQIMPATWTLTLEQFPDEIIIGRPPVSAISSITYYDTGGTSQTLADDQYQTDMSTQDGPARIKPAYGLVWPSTRSDKYNAVTVTFTAGYATASVVPFAIKHAVAFLVAHWFKNREVVGPGSIVSTVPAGLDMLLSLEDWGGYA